MDIILTAADHDRAGFVALARWTNLTEAEARSLVHDIDAGISDEQEPDIRTAPFTFVLDVMDGELMIGNSARCLPAQVAARLAPEQVSAWLEARPEPDLVAFLAIPTLPIERLKGA